MSFELFAISQSRGELFGSNRVREPSIEDFSNSRYGVPHELGLKGSRVEGSSQDSYLANELEMNTTEGRQ